MLWNLSKTTVSEKDPKVTKVVQSTKVAKVANIAEATLTVLEAHEHGSQ